jgi:hypothetical protein
MPHPRDVAIGDLALGPLREPIARDRGHDDIEGRAGDAMCRRVGQEWHQRQVLDEVARPAMRQDQGDPATTARTLVHEVDTDTVDVRAVVRETVQVALVRTPVVFVSPVVDEPLEISEVRPLLPCTARRRRGPACRRQAPLQLAECLVADLNREGLDRGACPPVAATHASAPTIVSLSAKPISSSLSPMWRSPLAA